MILNFKANTSENTGMYIMVSQNLLEKSLAYVISNFRQDLNYVGQVEIITYMPGMVI